MAEGIEIRVPFLDRKLIDFAHDLPINVKISHGEAKYILKASQEDRLSNDVLYRSKAGFGAPMRQWLTGTASDMVNDILLSKSCTQRGVFDIGGIKQLIADTKSDKIDGSYTLLSLMVIELWFRQFVDSNREKLIINKVANG